MNPGGTLIFEGTLCKPLIRDPLFMLSPRPITPEKFTLVTRRKIGGDWGILLAHSRVDLEIAQFWILGYPLEKNLDTRELNYLKIAGLVSFYKVTISHGLYLICR